MDLKRITVDEVLAAYAALALEPMHHGYVDFGIEGGMTHCCPAFAVACVRDPGLRANVEEAYDAEPDDFDDCSVAPLVYAMFGSDYTYAFTRAVDGMTRVIPDGDAYDLGRKDGLAVRAALWPEPANA